MMLYSETFKRGSAQNRRRAKRDPLALMVQLLEEKPGVGRDKIIALWKERCQADEDFNDAVYDYAATNMWTSLARNKDHTKSPEEKEREKKRRMNDVDQITEKIKSILIMELLAPNGKRWGDCTFGEVKKLGQAGLRLSRLGKPKQIIRNVLSEEQLQKAFA